MALFECTLYSPLPSKVGQKKQLHLDQELINCFVESFPTSSCCLMWILANISPAIFHWLNWVFYWTFSFHCFILIVLHIRKIWGKDCKRKVKTVLKWNVQWSARRMHIFIFGLVFIFGVFIFRVVFLFKVVPIFEVILIFGAIFIFLDVFIF